MGWEDELFERYSAKGPADDGLWPQQVTTSEEPKATDSDPYSELFKRYEPQDTQEGLAVPSFEPQRNVEPSTKEGPFSVGTPETQLTGEDITAPMADVVDSTSKYFAGSGIPRGVAGTAYAYYAGNEALFSSLGMEGTAELSRQKKEFWDKKREDYAVKEYDINPIDNPLIIFDPRYVNYSVGKMVPGVAATAAAAAAGAPGLIGSVIGGVTLSAEEAVDTYNRVYKETGDRWAAGGAALSNIFINSLGEAAGLDAMLKPVGGIITRYIKGGMGEGGTEMGQNFMSEISEILFTKTAEGYSMPDIVEYTLPKLGGIMRRSIGAGLGGFAVGGPLGAVAGSRTNIPSSREVAEAELARAGVILEEDVGIPHDARMVIEALEKLPQVELMSTTGTTQETASDLSQPVTTAQEVLTEVPIPELEAQEEQTNGIEALAEGKAQSQEVPSILQQPQTEQGVQQQTEVVPPVDQVSQSPVSQGQETPGVAPDGTVTGGSVSDTGPLVLERNHVSPEQITDIQQATASQAPTTALSPEAISQESQAIAEELTPAELEHARQIEPEVYGELEGSLFGKQGFIPGSYQGETLASAQKTMSQKGAPLAKVVRQIKEANLEAEVMAEVEKIVGPVKSMVQGATKVGDVTFRNIVNDVINTKRKQMVRGEVEVGTSTSVNTNGSTNTNTIREDLSSTNVNTNGSTIGTPLSNTNSISPSVTELPVQSTDMTQFSPELIQEEMNRLSNENTVEQERLLSKLGTGNLRTALRIAEQLGISKDVQAAAQSILGKTFDSLKSAGKALGSVKMSQLIKEVWDKTPSRQNKLLAELGKYNGPTLARVAGQLGIAKEVKAELEKSLDRVYPSIAQVGMVVGPKKMAQAIRDVWNQKLRENAIRNLQSTVQPSESLKALEDTLPSSQSVNPEPRKKRLTDDQIEDKRAKAEEETLATVVEEQQQDDTSILKQGVEEAKAGTRSIKEFVQENIGSAVEVLGMIHKKFKGIMKRYESKVLTAIKERQDQVQGLADIYKELDTNQKALFSRALMNTQTIEQRAQLTKMLNENPELAQEYGKARVMLDQITSDFIALGLLSRNTEMKHYFPRRVKDMDGLMDYLSEKFGDPATMIKELRKATGNSTLNAEEARATLQRLLERGQVPGMLLSPQSAKGRTIWDVTPEMMKYYMSPMEALDAHIREATEAIEQRRVIGSSKWESNKNRLAELRKKLLKTEAEFKEMASLEKSFAETTVNQDGDKGILTDFITETMLGTGDKLTLREQRLVLEIFRARFNQKAMGKKLAVLKDISLASALGQVGSTLTQLSDIMPLIREFGIMDTLDAMLQSKQLTKADGDVHAATRDLRDSSKASEFLDKVLTYTGFNAVDGFFASTNMQLALNRAKKMTEQELSSKYSHIFNPQELQQLKSDIDSNTMSKLAKEFAFIELSETRPLFPSDMPLNYMRGGNLRILYSLKSWTLKTLNNIYRDVREANKTGGKAAAAKTALSYILLLTAGGAGTDILRDLLMGRTVKVSESVIDSMLKMVFLNKFSVDNFTKDKDFGKMFTTFFTPPTRYINGPFADLYDAFHPDKEPKWKTVNELPVFGSLLYSWVTDAGKKRRTDDVRKMAFEILKDATLEEDEEAMKEFRELRAKYNSMVEGTDQKPISYESVTRARSRYRKEQREKARVE
jgi:hypothetical protein